MSDLSNNLINATYKKLLQVSTSGNTGISGTLTNIQTGDGTNTAVKIATSAVQVDGTLFVGQTFGVSGDASVAGGLAVANKVCASAFYGDGSNLTGLIFTGDVLSLTDPVFTELEPSLSSKLVFSLKNLDLPVIYLFIRVQIILFIIVDRSSDTIIKFNVPF